MSKQKCNYCQNNQVNRCPVCGNENKHENTIDMHSNLYAAEFMLYAFHFDPDGGRKSNPAAAYHLMMMVVEG